MSGSRDRGIRLGDLERDRQYLIGYVAERRRWEVIMELPTTVEPASREEPHRPGSEARGAAKREARGGASPDRAGRHRRAQDES